MLIILKINTSIRNNILTNELLLLFNGAEVMCSYVVDEPKHELQLYRALEIIRLTFFVIVITCIYPYHCKF